MFRRSLQIPVDDDFVKDIVTDEMNNWFNPDNPYESCVVKERIMIGESTNTAEARNFPPQEYHSLGDNVSAWPLTFKLFPQDLERWRSVVWACGMYRPPRDVGDFSATRHRDPPEQPPTPPPQPESSHTPPSSVGDVVSSSASAFSSPTTSRSFSVSHDTAVEVGPDEEESSKVCIQISTHTTRTQLDPHTHHVSLDEWKTPHEPMITHLSLINPINKFLTSQKYLLHAA